MANVLVEKESLQNIADSIRIKRKSEEKFKPGEMDDEILLIETDKTGDATATVDDIINPATAYVKNTKLTGAIMPTYENTNINYDITIPNNTGLGVYDINNDEQIALVGVRNSTSFYICKVDENGISNTNKISVPVSISDNSYTYKVSDVKFSSDNVLDNVITLYGVAEYHNNTLNNTNGEIQILVFAMKVNTYTLNIEESTTWTTHNTNNTNTNIGIGFNNFDYYFKIYTVDTTHFGVIPYYNQYHCIENEDITISSISSFFKYENNQIVYYGDWTVMGSETYKYINSKYILKCTYNPTSNGYSSVNLINSNYDSGTHLLSKTFEGSELNYKSALLGEYVLFGNELYNDEGTLIHTYDGELDPTLYKEYLGEHIYEINTATGDIKVYTFNTTTFEVTLETTITGAITNYIPYETQIHNKLYNNYKYLEYGLSSNLEININENTQSQVITSLTRRGKQFHNVSDADALASNVLQGKTFYNKTGKVVGSMPNNGEINITPTTSLQSIPGGYTTGGTVSAVTSSIDSNIQAENIKEGISILGVQGTLQVLDTSDATATANDMINPKTAYVNGTKITGAMIPTYKLVGTLRTQLGTSNIVTMKYVGNNYIVVITTTDINIYRIVNNTPILVITKDYTGTTNLTTSGLTISEYTANNDIRIIFHRSDKNGTMYYYNFNGNTDTINLYTYKFNDSMYTDGGFQLCISHSGKCLFLGIGQASTNGGEQWLANVGTTGITGATRIYYQKYGHGSSNVQFLHNDRLLMVTIDATRYRYTLNASNAVTTTKTDTTYPNLILNPSLEYGYNSSKLYSIDATDITNPTVTAEIMDLTGRTFKGFLSSKYILLEDGIYEILSNNTLSPILITGNTIYIGTNDISYIERISQSAENITFDIDNIQGQLLDKLDTVDGILVNTNECTTTEQKVLYGNVFVDRYGTHVGSMPNNGNLVITPTDTAQSLPTGYISGGTVNAVDITELNEYAECLAITEDILNDEVQE